MLDILNELLELYDRANHDEKIFRDRNNTTLKENYLFENSNYYSDIKKELNYSNKCHNLEEQLGCPLEVVVKAFQKYVSWTTDCDFGYDNIPDEYEKYKNDDKFKTLTYDSGLIYIAIQETLKEDKSE